MSLESLKAIAESEETEATEELPVDQAEDLTPEDGAEEDQGETEEAEESEDFELELEGEQDPSQQKPKPEQALVHKLTKERRKRQQAQSEADDLRAKIEALEARLAGGTPQAEPQQAPRSVPAKFPDLYDKGIGGDREKYNQAVQDYLMKVRQAEDEQSRQAQQKDQYRQVVEKKTERLAERAAKFMQENKIKEDRVISAIERATSEVDSTVKLDGALVHLLDSVGDGSERVAYYIGTNEDAMSKVKELLSSDPNGLSAIAHMTRLAEKLKPKGIRKTSKAPEPDEPLRGDGSSVSAKRLQDQYDKESDPNKLLKLRQKAKELGVKLN
jgi:hypothetical protein